MASRDELTVEGELQRLLHAEPFEPFTISLTSGERFEVRSPDLIIGQNVATLAISAARSTVIRKNQIVAIDSSNGHRD